MDHLASFFTTVHFLWFLKCQQVAPQSTDVSSASIAFCLADRGAAFISSIGIDRWYKYTYILRIQSITMYHLGYPHDGFMATPELGHRMCGYTLWGRIALWSHQSAQTTSSERCIVQIVNVPQGDSTQPRRVQLQCTFLVINIMALWLLLNLGTGCRVTHCGVGLHYEATRVLKLLAATLYIYSFSSIALRFKCEFCQFSTLILLYSQKTQALIILLGFWFLVCWGHSMFSSFVCAQLRDFVDINHKTAEPEIEDDVP